MNSRLTPEDRLQQHGDDFYELLMKTHEGLEFEQSAAVNARLVLILANEIGNLDILAAALARAAEE
ncbi:MAG: DUF2783 domain-containing protein [Sneathiella sp.]|nr:DUF2783 domain-containing protein [Sneathiella sp.]